MGFSPGNFKDKHGASFHWEVGSGVVRLWDEEETKLLLLLTLDDARKALAGLELIVDMLEEDAA